MCLEPPLRIDELPEDETWYCKKCHSERVRLPIKYTSLSSNVKQTQAGRYVSPTYDKDLRPIPAVFIQLCKRLDEDNPVQFKLPQDVRQFFAGGELLGH